VHLSVCTILMSCILLTDVNKGGDGAAEQWKATPNANLECVLTRMCSLTQVNLRINNRRRHEVQRALRLVVVIELALQHLWACV